MNEHIHLDTNVVLRALGGDHELSAFIQGKLPVVSVVVEMELRCYPLADEVEIKVIREFLSHARIQMFDERVKEEAIRIRKQHRLKLLDAMVAATARVDRYSLLTSDKAFKKLADEQSILFYEIPNS
jgi:predicted nucleic acid-binding protein